MTELMSVAEKGSATAEEFQNIVEAHLEAVKAACNVTETEEVTGGENETSFTAGQFPLNPLVVSRRRLLSTDI